MARFLTTLDGRWLDDDKSYMLLADLAYQSDILGGCVVTVPKGFVTDFASVPRVPVIYWLFGDRAHHESVIHDFLYQTHILQYADSPSQGLEVTRATADKVFKEAMIARGKSAFVTNGMYWGVRLGGASSYKSGPSRFRQLNIKGKLEASKNG